MIAATIFGRLTKEPEVTIVNNGTSLCKFCLAVNHGKDAQGQDIATFVNITVFGKTIDTVMKYLHKGARACVSAELKLNKYTNQQGVQGASLEGIANRVDVVDWPDKDTQQAQPQQPAQHQQHGGYPPIPAAPYQVPYSPPAPAGTAAPYPSTAPTATAPYSPPGVQENSFPYGYNVPPAYQK